MCKASRYPDELNGTKIVPRYPSHLPPQHTAILKWVNYTISTEDIREEMNTKYRSIFAIGEMAGTFSEKTRHVKVEIVDTNEYKTLLNSGRVSLYGQLIEVEEFLPAPRVRICGRCNQSGHTKKACRNSNHDICRRYGEDRTCPEQHKECPIKCHNCGGNHVGTDYKCAVIVKYRKQLIDELRRHPERLPPDTHLFIPSEYRNPNDKTRSIYNHEAWASRAGIHQSQPRSNTHTSVHGRL